MPKSYEGTSTSNDQTVVERTAHDAAVVLFSGGQDSTTCLFWAKQRFGRVETVEEQLREAFPHLFDPPEPVASDEPAPVTAATGAAT